MSLLIRRIVFVIATLMLPLQSWAAALVSDCAMTSSIDAPAHCGDDSYHLPDNAIHASSADQHASDTQATSECLAGADCHCSALYQAAIPFVFVAPVQFSNRKFMSNENRFVAIIHPPLWRPPIVV